MHFMYEFLYEFLHAFSSTGLHEFSAVYAFLKMLSFYAAKSPRKVLWKRHAKCMRVFMQVFTWVFMQVFTWVFMR